MKICEDGTHRESSASLNWVLGDRCQIVKVGDEDEPKTEV